MNLVAFSYMDRGMLDEAMKVDREMLSMNPRFAAAHWNLGIIHMLQGQREQAIGQLEQSVEDSGRMPPTLAILANAHAKSGDRESALALLAELEEVRASPERGYASPVLMAYVYEGLGEAALAMDWLELAVTERDGWLTNLNSFPRFDSLRDQPRFRDVLRRVNLPERKVK
jgi:tetratricopeptide (TPR) repeat protein